MFKRFSKANIVLSYTRRQVKAETKGHIYNLEKSDHRLII